MSDPLSITASVVGLTTAALQSVQFLVQTIDNVKGAPEILKGVTTDLRVIQPVLQNLIGSAQGAEQIVLSEQIKHAVENCERACGTFRSQVEHWMEHSTQDKMFWVDRWKVGLFGLERIKTFRGQLNDCKGTLSVALSTATVYQSLVSPISVMCSDNSSITTTRQEHLMQQLKDMMLQQNEAVIQQNITQAGLDTRAIELSMQQLPTGSDNELGTVLSQIRGYEQSRRELVHELEKQRATNQTFIRMCEEALSQTIYQRTGQKIKGVRATNNSSALTGFINTTGEESRIDQDLSDINADNYSIAVAGVVKNLDFKDLRPNGPNMD